MARSPWDRFAASYGRQVFLERAALRTLLELLPIAPSSRLLDVGCGPAVLLAELSENQRRPHEAVGVDSSAEMLRHAPELPDGWHLKQADATELPFADASFDLVAAGYVLHVMDARERSAAIAEMARVVRPGGSVGTITVAPPRHAWSRLLAAPVLRAAERSQGRLRGMRALDPSSELEAAGLRVVSSTRSFRGYPSLCVASKRAPAA